MTTPQRNAPTSTLVARAWARSVLPAAVGVDRVLPATATADMATVGFVVARVVGGGPDRDVPLREPVIGFECWVAPPADSPSIVQWNAAERLAGWLLQAAYDHPVTAVRLVFGDVLGAAFAAYRPARVLTVLPVSEPREAPDDPGNYARFDIDMQLNWTEN